MNPREWFSEQLDTGANAFIWSAQQVPDQRRDIPPPASDILGEWTARRHIYHLWNYEHNIAIPAMHIWLGEAKIPQKNVTSYTNEDVDWANYAYDQALEMFRQGRDQQLDLLTKFSEADWHETQETVWGDVALHWVVSKTFQHTMEHGCTLMQMALFWDMLAEREQNQSGSQ